MRSSTTISVGSSSSYSTYGSNSILKGNFTDPFVLLQVGFLNSGRVVALDVTYYGNAGNSMDLSQAVSIIINHRSYSSNDIVC